MRTDYILTEQLSHVYAALMPQNRLICQIMEVTGLRISDVVEMRAADFRQRMTIREKKTGKARRVYIPSGLFRACLEQSGDDWVFPGAKPGKHKTRQAVWKDVKRAAKAFRLPQNVAPHSLRKYYAVRLMERYGDLERVRKALSHDDIAVTLIYAMADRILSSGQRRSGTERGRAAAQL